MSILNYAVSMCMNPYNIVQVFPGYIYILVSGRDNQPKKYCTVIDMEVQQLLAAGSLIMKFHVVRLRGS